MMTAARTVQALVLLGLATALTGCTIQIGQPSQPASAQPTPTTEAEPKSPIIVPIKPESCDQIYELMIADGSPGRSRDLNVAIQAVNEATVTALADPNARDFGKIIEGYGQTLDKLHQAPNVDEETGSKVSELLSKLSATVDSAFMDLCS